MQLLVLPKPHQGLADAGAGVVVDVERRHPSGHRLFPVGHGDDLLALQGQEEQAPALEGGPAGVLGAPSVQPPLHLVQERGLEFFRPGQAQAGTVQVAGGLAGTGDPKKWASP